MKESFLAMDVMVNVKDLKKGNIRYLSSSVRPGGGGGEFCEMLGWGVPPGH